MVQNMGGCNLEHGTSAATGGSGLGLRQQAYGGGGIRVLQAKARPGPRLAGAAGVPRLLMGLLLFSIKRKPARRSRHNIPTTIRRPPLLCSMTRCSSKQCIFWVTQD